MQEMNLANNKIVEASSLKIAQLPTTLRWFGDSVLRQKAVSFKKDEITSQETKNLAKHMIATLSCIRERAGLGRALAAPQIGVLRRMIVIYNGEKNDFDVLINPKICSHSNEMGGYLEMCLSGIPLAGKVIRPWEIELDFYDAEGQHHRIMADPMLSRVAQHEIDHLNGKLFIDRADRATFSFVFDWTVLKTEQLVKI